ncbi:hypothetical protein [Hyphomicrobium sp.]|uniref:hypothetical protein n=1 Tax=Hyphomicrobium sp. TaxID=82 RepID=UPI002D79341D|nr:hypothetical protein [Hyphomicrobium sp.]HET6387826.1 hypothetical protein [Hyphomicrobium sp.]
MTEGLNIGLWLAVLASGVYHGINPGMGWPLAVAAGLMERRQSALLSALGPLAGGHFLAMTVILLPFGMLTALQYWSHEIRLAAAVIVICAGLLLLVYRRHPRFLARIPPSELGLWSFAVATAHGAGLMLVPMYLGLCTSQPSPFSDHSSAMPVIANNLCLAVLVAAAHATALLATGGLAAWLTYRYFGVRILSKAWINVDALWAGSLVAVGVVAAAGSL